MKDYGKAFRVDGKVALISGGWFGLVRKLGRRPAPAAGVS